jgi:hypothetical protein
MRPEAQRCCRLLLFPSLLLAATARSFFTSTGALCSDPVTGSDHPAARERTIEVTKSSCSGIEVTRPATRDRFTPQPKESHDCSRTRGISRAMLPTGR